MSRFQPHVSRDRDTSKGKSDFANVLTEGWANIFEPFVPVVCTVTSSGGGRGMSRRHFAATFFPFSLSLFFTRWKNNGEQRVRKTMRALVMRWYAWTSVEKCAVSPVENKRDEIVIPLDFRRNGDPHRFAIGWIEKFRFENPLLLDVRLTGWKKGEEGKKKKKDETASGKILSKSMESWGMKSVWRFDYETSEMNNLMSNEYNETKKKTVKTRLVWLVKNWRIEKRLKIK